MYKKLIVGNNRSRLGWGMVRYCSKLSDKALQSKSIHLEDDAFLLVSMGCSETGNTFIDRYEEDKIATETSRIFC